MIYYVGNTDYQWYQFLSNINPEDINFWQPGGKLHFRAIDQGAPFLLRLKSPINKIAGIGFFSSHSLLPIDFAWDVFQNRNGVDSFDDFKKKIISYRGTNNQLDQNPVVGCIILTNPIFFKPKDWINTPNDWFPNIVQGRTYDSSLGSGKELWLKVEELLFQYRYYEQQKENERPFIVNETEFDRYGEEIITRMRLGQGAFRILITDAYERKCAITGEKTLPVLEAAHIIPYEKSGPHFVSNGLLLRADIHKLFDKGYLTITNHYKVEVSKKIKEEYENGRDYYKYHGNDLIVLPRRKIDQPSVQFIEWHNSNIYKG